MTLVFRSTLIALIFLAVSAPLRAETFIWQAERGDQTVLLAGTVHMLKPADFPLPDAYGTAFDEAPVVVFETDVQAAQEPAFGTKVATRMRLPEGETLQSVLKPATWQQLQSFAAEQQLPLQAMQLFDPAMVSVTFSMMQMQKLGYSEGVDQRYQRRALEAGKEILYLETLDEQLGFLEAMKDVDPDKLVEATLADLENLPQMMDTAVAALRRGDAEALDKAMGEKMREEAPELYRVMLTDRNRLWADHVERYLQTPETELVMVGAMHLAGPENLRELLQERGIEVSRYEP